MSEWTKFRKNISFFSSLEFNLNAGPIMTDANEGCRLLFMMHTVFAS
jgi:hypothetical protein